MTSPVLHIPAALFFHTKRVWYDKGVTAMKGKGAKMQFKKGSSYSKAKVLTLIPVFVLAATVICLVLAAMLEDPTGKGVLYTIFAFAGLIGMLISPFPCLVMSVSGTVFAAKAGKEGIAGARKILVLGIIEISVHIVGVALAIMMFLVGQGV